MDLMPTTILHRSPVSQLDQIEQRLAEAFIEINRLRRQTGLPEQTDASDGAVTKESASGRVTTPLVVEVAEQLLLNHGELSLDDLDRAIRCKVTEMGYSLLGYEFCRRAALRAPQFVVDIENRVSLL